MPAMLVVLIVATGVRIITAWPGLTEARDLLGDEPSYVRLATSLAWNFAYSYDGTPTANKMPGFPAFIAPFYIWTGRPLAPLAVIVLVSVVTCSGIYLLGWQFYNRRIGFLAGLLGAVDVGLAAFGGYLLSEALYVLLFLVGILATTEARRRRSIRGLLLAGVFFGLAMLTRPQFLPMIPVLIGWTFLTWSPGHRRALATAMLLLSIVVVWAPWPIRNALFFGEFIPLTSQPCPPCTGIYHNGATDPSSPLTFAQWQPMPASPELNEGEARDQRRDRAIGWILENPTMAATIALAQAPLLWRPSSFGTSSLGLGPLWPTAFLADAALLLAAGHGLLLSLRVRHQGAMLWAAIAVALTAFAIVTIGDPRHRLVLHPALNVFAAVAITHVRSAKSSIAGASTTTNSERIADTEAQNTGRWSCTRG